MKKEEQILIDYLSQVGGSKESAGLYVNSLSKAPDKSTDLKFRAILDLIKFTSSLSEQAENIGQSLRHHCNMNFETLMFTKDDYLFIKVKSGEHEIEKVVRLYSHFDTVLHQAVTELTEKLDLPTLTFE